MANDHDVPLGNAQEPGAREGAVEDLREGRAEDPRDGAPEDVQVTGVHVSTEVAVRRLPQTAAVLRGRALALRTALPELARNPVVVGASAAAATVALRLAVDVARRALSSPTQPRSVDLTVTGSVLHHVHVIHHLHVIHHRSAADPLWPLPPPRA